jgi:hypothetical protein
MLKRAFKMKKLFVTTIVITGLFTKVYAQSSFCSADTFNLTLAYESGGQFSLDDQMIKSPGFVKFNGGGFFARLQARIL